MIYYFFSLNYIKELTFLSILITFIVTCISIKCFQDVLPKDSGRAYAINGLKSIGKPRGAGIIFIMVFIISSLIFLPFSTEIFIYLILTLAAMLSGYLDDSSKEPWGELKKGLIDLIIAFMVASTYLNFNSNTFTIALTEQTITLPTPVFGFFIIVLVWASINVTNCSDGVDGLCGTISSITLATIYLIFNKYQPDRYMMYLILLMICCILGYLWFNTSPSKLLMGDAGSRAIGLFIAVTILKTGRPLLYIPAAAILIIDGGIGLIKVSLLRFLKIHIMKNTRTPLHDHVHKEKGWSDSQAVFRFAVLQILISAACIFL